MILPMDAIDRKIIAELQAEGRLTVTELAQRVGLSVAPCHRRLRELERAGAIRGYRAVVDPAAIGLGFEVLVQVTMDREDAATVADFERGLAQIPESATPNGSSATPTTCCAWPPPTSPPTRPCATSGSPPCPAWVGSPPPSS
jgi:DNA-binding Lrp family transcriptional regulator